MTGPHLLAAVAYDEYYHDLPRMMTDLGKLLHQNFRRLAEAGCKHIQIDEPYFTVADDQEVRAAVEAINIGGRGPAGRCARPGPHLPGQLRRRPRLRRPDRSSLLRHRTLQGRHRRGHRVRRLPHRARHDAALSRACWETGSSASARSMCRIPTWRPADRSPTASRRTDGWRPSRRSSPAPAASIICRDTLRSGSFVPCGRPRAILRGMTQVVGGNGPQATERNCGRACAGDHCA